VSGQVDPREVAAALLPGALLLLVVAGGGGLVALTLEPAERTSLAAMLAPRGALLLFGFLVAAGVSGALLRAAYLRWVAGAARLAEEAAVLLGAESARALPAPSSAELQGVAGVIGRLAEQRDTLRADVAAQVQEASRSVEQERSRLAALMAELTQSVVVCNLDGRVLLYNARARLQFRALSTAPQVAGGAELIGLGRSIYGVLDRALIAHALESVQQRLARGAAHPSAQFVTGTRSGQLLRVQLAPVRDVVARGSAGLRDVVANAAPDLRESADGPALNGFVLMLDNITRDFAEESGRDRLLHALTEGTRASLGNLQAAVELLDDPALDAPTRERFLGVVRDEVAAMGRRMQDAATQTAQSMKTRWPLEDMQGADLLAAACRRIEAAHGCRASAAPVDADLWLKVDSFSVLQALGYLSGRLVDEYETRHVELRLSTQGPHARLDLVWFGQAMSTETTMSWETDPIRVGADSVALTVRDVVERHDGAFWFERERVRHACLFAMLLPRADAAAPLEADAVLRSESRPEVYDFDLFRASDASRALADRRLVDLVFTVFDTETTGLDPSGGDRILQIGATRIVAGKLRREDCFEQLVDPQRDIPAVGIPIHGITPEMVAGKPAQDVVLPAFHAYAADTVLVAHNAAFDMRFLELAEGATGVRFDQPVLDTLLLSAVAHPAQESHKLEAIAERLGVAVLGRHTALGDAMVTAEIFLKLVPALAERGITTLGEALEASRKTYLARVSY
jgi:DNA polymerase-3 subunit epsilon